jgi:hypothetical protein
MNGLESPVTFVLSLGSFPSLLYFFYPHNTLLHFRITRRLFTFSLSRLPLSWAADQTSSITEHTQHSRHRGMCRPRPV